MELYKNFTRNEEINKELLTFIGKLDIDNVGNLTGEIVEYIVVSVTIKMDEMRVVRRCNACAIKKKRESASGMKYDGIQQVSRHMRNK